MLREQRARSSEEQQLTTPKSHSGWQSVWSAQTCPRSTHPRARREVTRQASQDIDETVVFAPHENKGTKTKTVCDVQCVFHLGRIDGDTRTCLVRTSQIPQNPAVIFELTSTETFRDQFRIHFKFKPNSWVDWPVQYSISRNVLVHVLPRRSTACISV